MNSSNYSVPAWQQAWLRARAGIRHRLTRALPSGLRSLALLAFCLLVPALAAHAQNTGSILGSVVDKSGAVVPNAAVTAADITTGTNRAVKSNSSGEYSLTSLPVGTYILTVAAPNFETSVITGIHIDANASIKEQVTLQTGAASDSVTVQDTEGSSIDPNSATIATLIDPKLIEDLPIDGHNVVALSALLPGVVDVNAPTTFTGDTKGPTYSASGSRNTQNLMLFDGLMWNNLFYNTGINYPTPNALQEVSVLLNNYKAEYGRNAGSVFNVITKRGTNKIHGAVWDYLQNQYFNAADYISKVNPKDNINQFGFTVQAPILRDKLFVAGAYQQLIGRLQTTASANTPGYAERGLQQDGKTPFPCNPLGPFKANAQGCANFAAESLTKPINNPESITGASGSGATPDVTTAQLTSNFNQAGGVGTSPCVGLFQAAGNATGAATLPYPEVPAQCLDPVFLAPDHKSGLFDTFLPVAPVSGAYITTHSPAPTGDQNGLIRLDYNLRPQHTIDLRYNLFQSTSNSPQGVNSQSQGLANYVLLANKAVSNFANVGYQWVITPSLLNELRFGYKRFESTQSPSDNRNLNSFGGNFVEPGISTLPAISISNLFTLGSSNQGYQDHINENVELAESLSWTKGNHNVKGGFNFLRLQYLTRSDFPGQLSFSTTFTGIALADAELGLLNSVTAANRLIQGGIQHNVFTYLQDDWRITPKLTLNLGVRYELPYQWFEPHGESATFVPGLQSHVYPNAPGGLGFPGDPTVASSLVPTDFNGVAPRVGFAYDVSGKGRLLIRGGYGIFFDAVNANVVGVGQPYHYNFFKLTPPGGASVPLATFGVNPQGVPDGSVLKIPDHFDPVHPQFIAPYSNFFPDRNFRTPYVMAVNFGFQYHLPHAGVLDVNYVGKFARKLTIPVDLNPAIFDCSGGYFQANPSLYCNATSTAQSTQQRLRYQDFNYGGQGLVDIKSIGTSSYNALQAQYTQRGGRYLTILSSYTYSRSIDIQTNAQTTANSVPNVFNAKSDRGPSDNNATHNVTLGWVVRYPKAHTSFAPINAVLNDWVYSGQYLAHTGRPYSVTINNDTALVGEPGQRAALVPGRSPFLPSGRHRSEKVAEYFDPYAFTYPQIGTFSPIGRNAFVGPGYIMTNMTLGRDFPLAHLREGMRLNVRAEAFNVFNTPNLANPYAQFSCTTTSISTLTQPGIGCDQIHPPGNPTSTTPGTVNNQIGVVRNTFGNNANTSTNGRKMQFAATVFF